jgi:hypothetical protein
VDIILFILSQPSIKSGIELELMAKRASNGMKEVYIRDQDSIGSALINESSKKENVGGHFR